MGRCLDIRLAQLDKPALYVPDILSQKLDKSLGLGGITGESKKMHGGASFSSV